MFTIFVWLVVMTFILSLLWLDKLGKDVFRDFRWFLGLTAVAEAFGYYWYFIHHAKSNYWIYNGFLAIEFAFLTYLFWKFLDLQKSLRVLLIVGAIIFYAAYCYEMAIEQFQGVATVTRNIFSVTMILYSLLFYYQLIKDPAYRNLMSYPPFWVVTGCFLFYAGSVGVDLLYTYLIAAGNGVSKPLRYIVFIVLNLILYGCWSYSFLCKYRQRISSRLQ